jgi:hypothetical protein
MATKRRPSISAMYRPELVLRVSLAASRSRHPSTAWLSTGPAST